MSQKSTKALMKLSNETKLLINQGTFSLFSLASAAGAVGEFLLRANSKNFLLDHSGEIIRTIDSLDSVTIVGSVKFPNVHEPVYSFGKLNIA